MADKEERRTNHTLRRRVDDLLRRVRESRQEIVERGLDAVHKDEPQPVEGTPDGTADKAPPRS
jgi:hypothetical protein